MDWVSPQPQLKRLKVAAHSAPVAQHAHTALVVVEQFGTRTTQIAVIPAMATETNQVVAHMDHMTGRMAARVALVATAAGEASGHKAKSASNTNEGNC